MAHTRLGWRRLSTGGSNAAAFGVDLGSFRASALIAFVHRRPLAPALLRAMELSVRPATLPSGLRTPDITLSDLPSSPLLLHEPLAAGHLELQRIGAQPSSSNWRDGRAQDARQRWLGRLASPLTALLATAWLLAFVSGAMSGGSARMPSLGSLSFARRGGRSRTAQRLRALLEPLNTHNATAGYDGVQPSTVCVIQSDNRGVGDELDRGREIPYWEASSIANALYAMRHGYQYRVRALDRRG